MPESIYTTILSGLVQDLLRELPEWDTSIPDAVHDAARPIRQYFAINSTPETSTGLEAMERPPMGSKDVEAIFHIRKARQAVPDDDVWADHMFRAVALVGLDRVVELSKGKWCQIS